MFYQVFNQAFTNIFSKNINKKFVNTFTNIENNNMFLTFSLSAYIDSNEPYKQDFVLSIPLKRVLVNGNIDRSYLCTELEYAFYDFERMKSNGSYTSFEYSLNDSTKNVLYNKKDLISFILNEYLKI